MKNIERKNVKTVSGRSSSADSKETINDYEDYYHSYQSKVKILHLKALLLV